MHTAKTVDEMRQRLEEHMKLVFPTLRSPEPAVSLLTTAYVNGDMIRFISSHTGEPTMHVTMRGAIKFGRRWLIQGSHAAYTGVELKAFMQRANCGYAAFARF